MNLLILNIVPPNLGTMTLDHTIRAVFGKVNNRLAAKRFDLSVDPHRIAYHINRRPLAAFSVIRML